MRWKKARRSDNVVDQRGKGRAGGKGLSLAAVAVIVVMGLLSGQDPLHIIGNIATQAIQQGGINTGATRSNPAATLSNDPQSEFVRAILGDTEDTWRALFKQAGQTYKDPSLILFSGKVRSACGLADSAVGPFYCPGDQQVYLDLSFLKKWNSVLPPLASLRKLMSLLMKWATMCKPCWVFPRACTAPDKVAHRLQDTTVFWYAKSCKPTVLLAFGRIMHNNAMHGLSLGI